MTTAKRLDVASYLLCSPSCPKLTHASKKTRTSTSRSNEDRPPKLLHDDIRSHGRNSAFSLKFKMPMVFIANGACLVSNLGRRGWAYVRDGAIVVAPPPSRVCLERTHGPDRAETPDSERRALPVNSEARDRWSRPRYGT